MKIYAQLNENKVCIAISQLNGEVIQDNLIEIPSISDEFMWKNTRMDSGQRKNLSLLAPHR